MVEAANDGTDQTAMEQTKDAEKKLKLKLSKAKDAFLKSETEDGSFIDVVHTDRLVRAFI